MNAFSQTPPFREEKFMRQKKQYKEQASATEMCHGQRFKSEDGKLKNEG